MPPIAKHWCFTLNNYTDDDIAGLEALGSERPELSYLIFAKEVGESGTPHLQGYISFTKRKTLASVKGTISERAHLEVSRGTPKQASEYCKKPDTSPDDIFEYGTLPGGQGARIDLMAVATAIREHTPTKRIAHDHPEAFIRYSTGILRYKSLHTEKRNGPPQIFVYWGRTGTCKTRRVFEFADIDKLWVHPGEAWFDGYDGQPAVLFDDYDRSAFKLSYLLRLLDRYPIQVPVKGAYSNWIPKNMHL